MTWVAGTGMANENDERILRIGVLQSGKIVEERLLRTSADVSVGTHSRNTFSLASKALPSRFSMFKSGRSGYTLMFTEEMQGRVSGSGGAVFELDQLREEGKARQKGGVWQLSLDEATRGKIVIGDVTLLFQFVRPPRVVSRPQLPASVRGSWLNQLDMPLLATIALSMVLQLGSAGGLHIWWERTGKYETPVRSTTSRALRSLIVEVEKVETATPEDEKDEKEEEKKDEDKKEEAKAEEKPVWTPKPKAKPKKAASRKQAKKVKELSLEQRRAKVRRASALHFLSAKGEGESTLQDTLKDGITAKHLDDAWSTTGVVVARPGEEAAFRGGPKKADDGGDTYRNLGKDDMKGPRAGKVRTSRKSSEVKVKGKVGIKKGKVLEGKADASGVASVIKRRQSAIRKCYEEGLRSNPKLSGKVYIKFTIGSRGRVTKAKVDKTKGSVGDTVGKCIVRRLKGWKFPKPDDGSATFRYPFVLTRAN